MTIIFTVKLENSFIDYLALELILKTINLYWNR